MLPLALPAIFGLGLQDSAGASETIPASAIALACLAELDAADPARSAAAHARDLAYVHDANPSVRMAALTALAALDHRPAPETSRGADLTGTVGYAKGICSSLLGASLVD